MCCIMWCGENWGQWRAQEFFVGIEGEKRVGWQRRGGMIPGRVGTRKIKIDKKNIKKKKKKKKKT